MTTTSVRSPSPPAPAASSDDGRHVLVIGAGLGGLAAAVRLRHRGFRVTLVDRHSEPGGRCGLWQSEGFQFDTGPTLLLMVEYLRALFAEVGRPVEEYLDLRQLDPNYRVHYADGSTLDVTSRINALLEGLERIEPGVGPRFLAFLSQTARLYRIGLDGFVDRNVHRRGDFFNLKNAALMLRARAMERLQHMVRRFFRSEKLQHTFSFQSLYLGLSPFVSPAIYSLLPYTEVAGGLYFPMGGMHALPRALARLASELGVDVRLGHEVTALERVQGRVSSAVLADGTRLTTDLVLANADLPYVYQTLLGQPYPGIDRFDFSCSAFLMYLGVGRSYPGLTHHALVVPRDLRATCDAIFAGRMPEDPAYYICNPNKTDPTLAPAGCENIYVLVPVPSQHRDHPLDWTIEGPKLEATMLDRLERFGLTDLRHHIRTRRTFTPVDFSTEFFATRGEAFGLAHGIDQVGWFRPHNRHPTLENLYFVGQSTHPGCGIPMVLISSRLVVERMVEEQEVRG